MNLTKNEKVQTLVTIGGLFALAGLVVTVFKSAPVANMLAKFKSG